MSPPFRYPLGARSYAGARTKSTRCSSLDASRSRPRGVHEMEARGSEPAQGSRRVVLVARTTACLSRNYGNSADVGSRLPSYRQRTDNRRRRYASDARISCRSDDPHGRHGCGCERNAVLGVEPSAEIDEIAGNNADLNTPAQDGCPIQSPDGLSLYMASKPWRRQGWARHLGCDEGEHERSVGGTRGPPRADQLVFGRLLPESRDRVLIEPRRRRRRPGHLDGNTRERGRTLVGAGQPRPNVNTSLSESRPSLSWDAEQLLFGRAGPAGTGEGGTGLSDMYVSTR
jgi:hypothetical protein